MSNNSRPPARSIADFQLQRKDSEFFRLIPRWYFDYLEPYLGATTIDDWNTFTVNQADRNDHAISNDSESGSDDWNIVTVNQADGNDDSIFNGSESGSDDFDGLYDRFLLSYATSPQKQTYQVLNADLVRSDGQRITEMRLHEMIRSTWAMETDAELTRLGIRQIENASARTAILHEYERAASNAIRNEFQSAISQGANPVGLTVTISGAGEGVLSPYWNDNPFLRTAVRVAGDAARVTAHLIREDTDGWAQMHMFMELDGGREGRVESEGQE